jgi:antitoxin (DNA-binding transcriptional repressor) of toxin-antitoxin stability system
MKHIGVREFRDRATSVLRSDEPIAIERHGRVIGFYIPVQEERDGREELLAALGRLEARVAEITREGGISEDELAEDFDLPRGEGGR